MPEQGAVHQGGLFYFAMQPQITVDTASIDAVQRAMRTVPGGLAKVLERSANRAAKGMRTDAAREGRKIYGLKHRDILDGIRLIRAHADRGKYSVGIDIKRKAKARLSLARYSMRPSRPASQKGVPRSKRKPRQGPSVLVRKDSGRKLIRGGFAIRTGEDPDSVMIFVREGKKRTPLKALRAPGIKSVLMRSQVRGEVKDRALARFTNRLPQDVKNMLRSRLPRSAR